MIQFSDDSGATWYTLADFGLILQPGHDHPFIPHIVNNSVAIGGMDGEIDFGGRNGVRPFKFPLAYPYETTVAAMQQRGRAFASFLSDERGRPRTLWLRFEYELDKYYSVRCDGAVVPARRFERATFDLTMTAYDPFAYQIDLATDITWDSWISMDNDKLTFDDSFAYAVTGSGTIQINNFGDLIVWPVIVLSGSFTTLSISIGDRTLVYGEAMASGTLTIDCGKMTARYGTVNKNSKVSGRWPQLAPGVNDVTISGTGLNCTASFPIRAKYL